MKVAWILLLAICIIDALDPVLDPMALKLRQLHTEMLVERAERAKARYISSKAQADRAEGQLALLMTNLSTNYLEFPKISYTEYIQKFDLSELYAMLPGNLDAPLAYNYYGQQPKHPQSELAFQATHLIPQS